VPVLQIQIDTSQLEGFIQKALVGLEQVETIMDEELARGMYMAADLAQVYVPVDTGRLRDSIRVEGGGGSYTLIADAKNPNTGMGYASFVEFGSSRQFAQPFIYPALSEVMPEMKANILGRIALTILGREYLLRRERVYEVARAPTGRFIKWYGEVK